MKYAVIIEQTKTGFSAYVPDLPGCIATSKTKELVRRRIQEAVGIHLESMLEDGFMASPAVSGKALFLRTRTHLYRIQN